MKLKSIGSVNFYKGFTLVELSISLIIVGLLLGIFLLPFATQMEIKKSKDSRNQIEVIKEAIIGFSINNGRLPCPADPTLESNQDGSGEELMINDISSCKLNFGTVPWKNLGVSETDAWGRRFGYRTSVSFSDVINANTVSPPLTCLSVPEEASFALCSQGEINVSDIKGTTLARNLAAVILSYGKNGYGAFLSNGKQISSENANQKEKLNSIDPSLSVIDQNLYLNFIYGTNNVDSIDDIVDWISPHILFNRMVQAGKLP